MTANKSTLQALFENGDLLTGPNFANLIDSYVNVAETSAQTVQSPIVATEFIAPRVSATNVNVTGLLSVNSAAIAGDVTVSGTVAVGGLLTNAEIFAGGFQTNGAVSAGSANIGGGALSVTSTSIEVDVNISAESRGGHFSYLSTNLGVRGQAVITNAAGTTQASAATLPWWVNRCKGVTDGAATGFIMETNANSGTVTKGGMLQVIINETAASANLWPPVGAKINALATDAPFPMAASTMYFAVQTTAAGFWVK